jgi:hypothetical protein
VTGLQKWSRPLVSRDNYKNLSGVHDDHWCILWLGRQVTEAAGAKVLVRTDPAYLIFARAKIGSRMALVPTATSRETSSLASS